MSTQLFNAAKKAIPDLDAKTAQGDFSALLDWLRTNVHQHGRRKTAGQILLDATGSELSSESGMHYAQSKFGELYGF